MGRSSSEASTGRVKRARRMNTVTNRIVRDGKSPLSLNEGVGGGSTELSQIYQCPFYGNRICSPIQSRSSSSCHVTGGEGIVSSRSPMLMGTSEGFRSASLGDRFRKVKGFQIE